MADSFWLLTTVNSSHGAPPARESGWRDDQLPFIPAHAPGRFSAVSVRSVVRLFFPAREEFRNE
jgi:hypothetical protein